MSGDAFRRWLLAVSLTVLLAGCGSSEPPRTHTAAAATGHASTPWTELQACLNSHPLFAGLLSVHGASHNPGEPGAQVGSITVFDQIHGSVANITEYANHAKAVANANAGNAAVPATPAENGQAAEPAEPAATPRDSGRYVWTAGPLTYTLNGRELSDDTSQAVVNCINTSYGAHAPLTVTAALAQTTTAAEGPAGTGTETSTTGGSPSGPMPELLCVEGHITVPKLKPTSCVLADEQSHKAVSEYPHVVNMTWSSWGSTQAEGTGEIDGLAVRLELAKPVKNITTGGPPIFAAVTVKESTTGATLMTITH